jgi:hypothetical protein
VVVGEMGIGVGLRDGDAEMRFRWRHRPVRASSSMGTTPTARPTASARPVIRTTSSDVNSDLPHGRHLRRVSLDGDRSGA